MKEEQAKTKWCPMARQVAVDDGLRVENSASFNRASKTNENGKVIFPSACFCIGSGCMMWSADQNVEQKREVCDSTNNPETSKPDGDDWYVINTFKNVEPNEIVWRRYVDTDSGDCGLKQEIRYA